VHTLVLAVLSPRTRTQTDGLATEHGCYAGDPNSQALIFNKNINCAAPLQKTKSFLLAVNKVSLLRDLLLILNSFAALSIAEKKRAQRFLSYSVNCLAGSLIEISFS